MDGGSRSAIPEELKDRLGAELKPGEQVVWVAVPQPPAGIPPLTWAVAFSGLIDLAAATFFIASAITGIGPLGNMPVLTIVAICSPHFLIGPALTAAPLWMPGRLRRAAARSLYVITDRRAITFNGGYFGMRGTVALYFAVFRPKRLFGKEGRMIRSFAAGEQQSAETVSHDDGTTDLLFGGEEAVYNGRNSTMTVRNGFYSLPDSAEPRRLLDQLAAQA
jgi:hypothetical protein